MTTNKLKDLEEQLYIACHGLPKKGNPEEIWENIKKEPEVLTEAIQLRKDKFGEKDLFKGTTIAEALLVDYQNTDKEIYQKIAEAYPPQKNGTILFRFPRLFLLAGYRPLI